MSTIFSVSSQISSVSTFSDLVNTDFRGEINALCWYRDLDGDFNEIVGKLYIKENITEVYPEDLIALQLSEKGNIARDIILNDIQLLADFGASPSLNLLKCYERDDEFDFISTDVYSFHVDRSPIATDTFLCTYHGAASDIISNSQAEQKILIPEIRAKLKELHNGTEQEFENFLKENYFDLHYQAHADVEPINLGLGHLWRLAVDHPKQQVLPCIHRAPLENEGEYRLLLIC
ncbi:DUF1826 domain-containing protein [Flavobacterium sp. LC2016-12]|uniref:DUF1826 domain-containing protein n=1 Tax=Flavobacterium sp. LC2016-12 TaxID=2783794 RepID=UPI00188AEFD6|nr:DUF1826 domain-containing protein [Flavobacterium sp. LC2016-12]MBF4466289.1 DUF1826 domain-containing protein [Flavobacterium sp. LC2016-12]